MWKNDKDQEIKGKCKKLIDLAIICYFVIPTVTCLPEPMKYYRNNKILAGRISESYNLGFPQNSAETNEMKWFYDSIYVAER